MEGNLTEQENEKELLSAMFESDILSIEDSVITVIIQTLHHTLALRTLYHEQYPSDSAPILAILDPNNQGAVKLSETEDHCEVSSGVTSSSLPLSVMDRSFLELFVSFSRTFAPFPHRNQPSLFPGHVCEG